MNNNIKHHFANAISFSFLILWYYVLHELGFFEYSSSIMPEEYQGAGLMLGIGFGMTPAFFIWSRFNRWSEKKLHITGIYYEDGFYKDEKNKDEQ